MEENYDFKNVRESSVLKGRVVRKSEGDIFVDVGYKSEGIIPAEETERHGYYDSVKEGDEIDVFVKKRENNEGMVALSKIIADKKIVFSRVKKAAGEKSAIEGEVVKTVKGGYIINFGSGVTAFMPMSHSKEPGMPVENIEGKKLPLKILQFDEVKRNVVVSYREYAAEKVKEQAEKLKEVFPEGEKTDVKITGASDNGVKVEKEGMRAFIPASELAWKKIDSVPEQFKEGYVITVKVTGFDRGKALLSLKRTRENPFKKFFDEKNPGDKVKAKVKEALKEGIVVEIGDELDGFIPSGEISYYRKIKNPADEFEPGNEITASVLSADEQKNRVFLSMKRTGKNPWHVMEERYPAGARAVGVIKELKEGEGVFVELEENFDAFVHISNISWFNFNKIEDILKPGEKKEFRILGVDKSKHRILLGIKQMTPSPWASFLNKYKEGNHIDVKIMEIEENSIICRIVDGVSGRVFIKNRNRLRNKKGDIIKARINKIDREQKKVFLGAMNLEITEEKKQLDEYMKTHEHGFKMDDIANFGDVKKEDQK